MLTATRIKELALQNPHLAQEPSNRPLGPSDLSPSICRPSRSVARTTPKVRRTRHQAQSSRCLSSRSQARRPRPFEKNRLYASEHFRLRGLGILIPPPVRHATGACRRAKP